MLDIENVSKITENIYFYKLRISFIVFEDLFLPVYKGAAFRGSFGEVFKQLFCKTKLGKCNLCEFILNCDSSYFFERPLQNGHMLYGKYTKPPRPYLIIPMDDKKTAFKIGDIFFFDFVLIGESVKFLKTILKVFRKMGEVGIGKDKSKFTISSIEYYNSSNFLMPLEEGQIPQKITIKDLPQLKIQNNLKISFLNSVRFLKDRKPLEEPPSFNIFIDNLARRISLLSHLYCNCEWVYSNDILEMDKNVKILKHNLNNVDWTRWSGTKGIFVRFDGKKGNIIYQGVPEYWADLINIGTWLHIGTTATYGLGKFSIQTFE